MEKDDEMTGKTEEASTGPECAPRRFGPSALHEGMIERLVKGHLPLQLKPWHGDGFRYARYQLPRS